MRYHVTKEIINRAIAANNLEYASAACTEAVKQEWRRQRCNDTTSFGRPIHYQVGRPTAE